MRVDSTGGINMVAGAAAEVGDEVFLDYWQGLDEALTDARVLAQYGFDPACCREEPEAPPELALESTCK